MGVTHVPWPLRGLGSPIGTYEADFLVDGGAPDSMAPANELRRIGVRPLAGRSTNWRSEPSRNTNSGCRRSTMGEITAGRIIFGPDDAEPLLGDCAGIGGY